VEGKKEKRGKRKEKSGYLFSNFNFLFSKNIKPLEKQKLILFRVGI